MTNVLFICLGNICRSPMMEGIAHAHWQVQEARSPVQFDSAGIGDWHAGNPPDPRAIAIARRHGVDISTQRARALVESGSYVTILPPCLFDHPSHFCA